MQRWIIGSHIVAQLKANMESSLCMQRSTSRLKDLSPKRMKFDEESVQKCYDMLHTWTPVFEDSYDIVSLSSSVNASPEV